MMVLVKEEKKPTSDTTSQSLLHLAHERLKYINQYSINFMFSHVVNSMENVWMPVNYMYYVCLDLRLNEEIFQIDVIKIEYY